MPTKRQQICRLACSAALNAGAKDKEYKITVNDFLVKACALACKKVALPSPCSAHQTQTPSVEIFPPSLVFCVLDGKGSFFNFFNATKFCKGFEFADGFVFFFKGFVHLLPFIADSFHVGYKHFFVVSECMWILISFFLFQMLLDT